MDHSLSKFELWWIYISGHNLPKLSVFREFKFEMESSAYFKIHEVWEEVPITKVVPNCIFYLQQFFRFLFPFHLFFAC
jgi:hypothetical protein